MKLDFTITILFNLVLGNNSTQPMAKTSLGAECSWRDPSYQNCEKIVPVSLINKQYLKLEHYVFLCNAVNLGGNMVSVLTECFEWNHPEEEKHYITSGSNFWCKDAVKHSISTFSNVQWNGEFITFLTLNPPLDSPCTEFKITDDIRHTNIIGWKVGARKNKYINKTNDYNCDDEIRTAGIYKHDGSFYGFQHLNCDQLENKFVSFNKLVNRSKELNAKQPPVNENFESGEKIKNVFSKLDELETDIQQLKNQTDIREVPNHNDYTSGEEIGKVFNKLEEQETDLNYIKNDTQQLKNNLQQLKKILDNISKDMEDLKNKNLYNMTPNDYISKIPATLGNYSEINSEELHNIKIQLTDLKQFVEEIGHNNGTAELENRLTDLEQSMDKLRDNLGNYSETNPEVMYTIKTQLAVIKQSIELRENLENNSIAAPEELSDLKTQLKELKKSFEEMGLHNGTNVLEQDEGLENRVSVLEQSIDKLWENMGNSSEANPEELSGLKTQLAELKKSFEEMELSNGTKFPEQDEGMENRVSALEQSIDKLWENLDSSDEANPDELSGLKTQLAELKKSFEQMGLRNGTNVLEQDEGLENRVLVLEQSIDKLWENLGNSNEANPEELSGLKTQLAELKKSFEEMELSNGTKFPEQDEGLENRVSALEQSIDKLWENLDSSDEANPDELSGLKTQLVELKKSFEQMGLRNGTNVLEQDEGLENRVSVLEQSIDKLWENLGNSSEANPEELSGLKTQLAELKKSFEEMELSNGTNILEQYEGLENRVSVLEQSINKLWENLGNSSDLEELVGLRNQLEKLKKSFEQMGISNGTDFPQEYEGLENRVSVLEQSIKQKVDTLGTNLSLTNTELHYITRLINEKLNRLSDQIQKDAEMDDNRVSVLEQSMENLQKCVGNSSEINPKELSDVKLQLAELKQSFEEIRLSNTTKFPEQDEGLEIRVSVLEQSIDKLWKNLDNSSEANPEELSGLKIQLAELKKSFEQMGLSHGTNVLEQDEGLENRLSVLEQTIDKLLASNGTNLQDQDEEMDKRVLVLEKSMKNLQKCIGNCSEINPIKLSDVKLQLAELKKSIEEIGLSNITKFPEQDKGLKNRMLVLEQSIDKLWKYLGNSSETYPEELSGLKTQLAELKKSFEQMGISNSTNVLKQDEGLENRVSVMEQSIDKLWENLGNRIHANLGEFYDLRNQLEELKKSFEQMGISNDTNFPEQDEGLENRVSVLEQSIKQKVDTLGTNLSLTNTELHYITRLLNEKLNRLSDQIQKDAEMDDNRVSDLEQSIDKFWKNLGNSSEANPEEISALKIQLAELKKSFEQMGLSNGTNVLEQNEGLENRLSVLEQTIDKLLASNGTNLPDQDEEMDKRLLVLEQSMEKLQKCVGNCSEINPKELSDVKLQLAELKKSFEQMGLSNSTKFPERDEGLENRVSVLEQSIDKLRKNLGNSSEANPEELSALKIQLAELKKSFEQMGLSNGTNVLEQDEGLEKRLSVLEQTIDKLLASNGTNLPDQGEEMDKRVLVLEQSMENLQKCIGNCSEINPKELFDVKLQLAELKKSFEEIGLSNSTKFPEQYEGLENRVSVLEKSINKLWKKLSNSSEANPEELSGLKAQLAELKKSIEQMGLSNGTNFPEQDQGLENRVSVLEQSIDKLWKNLSNSSEVNPEELSGLKIQLAELKKSFEQMGLSNDTNVLEQNEGLEKRLSVMEQTIDKLLASNGTNLPDQDEEMEKRVLVLEQSMENLQKCVGNCSEINSKKLSDVKLQLEELKKSFEEMGLSSGTKFPEQDEGLENRISVLEQSIDKLWKKFGNSSEANPEELSVLKTQLEELKKSFEEMGLSNGEFPEQDEGLENRMSVLEQSIKQKVDTLGSNLSLTNTELHYITRLINEKLNRLSDQIEKITEPLDVDNNNERLEKRIEALENHLEDKGTEPSTFDNDKTKFLEEKVVELEKIVNGLLETNKDLKKRLDKIDENLEDTASYKTEIEKLQNIDSEQNQKISEIMNKIENTQDSSHGLVDRDKTNEELKELRGQLDAANDDFKTKIRYLQNVNNEQNEQISEIQKNISDLEDIRKKTQDLPQILKDTEKTNEEVTKKLMEDMQKKDFERNQEISGISEYLSAMNEQQEDLIKENEALNKRALDLENNLGTLIKHVTNLDHKLQRNNNEDVKGKVDEIETEIEIQNKSKRKIKDQTDDEQVQIDELKNMFSTETVTATTTTTTRKLRPKSKPKNTEDPLLDQIKEHLNLNEPKTQIQGK